LQHFLLYLHLLDFLSGFGFGFDFFVDEWENCSVKRSSQLHFQLVLVLLKCVDLMLDDSFQILPVSYFPLFRQHCLHLSPWD